MGKAAVGFYWTLPVPWAGFRKLPANIDEAAAASRTIRYQRALIRRYAKENNYELVHEEAFLEIEPDRGSDLVREPLQKVEAICRNANAMLLFVDFTQVQGWRSHRPMADWAQRASVDIESIYPGEIDLDGEHFSPDAHFSDWRLKQRDWSHKKAERRREAFSRAAQLRAEGHSYHSIAETLNRDQMLSATGKPWTADNVGKLVAGGSSD
jgi:hypothetical protein